MKPTILVVDDDPNILSALEILLRTEDMHVLTAQNGEEALSRFRLHQPDLIVLDVEMPLMSGLEVSRTIRESSQVPILFLSGLGGAEDRLDGLATGADDYVEKPVHPRELLLRVRRMLER